MALVIVLCMLVLISGIVVAFFSGVSSEYVTAKSASNGATAKELADSTVQMVMGQIRQATSQGANICWASQPGMIRTWGEPGGAASSAKLGFYKLYSSGTMVVDATVSSSFKPEDDLPTSSWASAPALYTDLNAPLAGTSGTSYPIIDGNDLAALSGTSKSYVSGANPIVDGFEVVTSGSNAAPVASGASANPVPMPVKWLYVLRDGSLVAPDTSSTGSSATFSGAKAPTATNPIVGRVAFWTDDETCKLNLNTVCGGDYWEDPVFTSDMDLAFSRYKPLAMEYNRYRGHPATTSLMPVLWNFAGMASPYENLFPSLDKSTHSTGTDLTPYFSTTAQTAFKNILQISPRNAWGGSQMGTNPTEGYGCDTTPLVPDCDRLYASVDEVMFGYPKRGDSGTANAISLGKDQLKKLRFFLTTTSRAPETNPLNQPKVGIWPVPELVAKRSPADKLIAFCSTLKPDTTGSGNAYYFTRNNAQSATADWTNRNSRIFDYLDAALKQKMPGFGGSMATRYPVVTDSGGSSRDGVETILALIYDYIRSTFNLLDTNVASDATFLGSASNCQTFGFGQVVPIQITKGGATYKGAGRFPLIKEVAVMFMVRASNQPPLVCFTNSGKPIIYAATSGTTNVKTSGTSHPYQDDNGALTTSGSTLVLSGLACAQLSMTHPWVTGTFSQGDTVNQFKDTAGHPVLIVNTGTGGETVLFPVFSSVSSGTYGVKDNVGGGRVAFIANQYPTLYGDTANNGYWGITASGSTATLNGYTYAIGSTPATDGKLNAPQTHAGMPYLTVQSLSSGAFTQANPRYQGKDASSAYELPKRTDLPPGSTEMQALFLVDPVNVANGVTPMIPKYQVVVEGLNAFRVNGQSLGFGSTVTQCSQQLTGSQTPYYNLGMHTISIGPGFYGTTRTSKGTNQFKLSFIGTPAIVSGTSFPFTGGTTTLQMYIPPVPGSNSNPVDQNASTLVQTYHIQFPNDTFPTPELPPMPSGSAGAQSLNELFVDATSGTTMMYKANNKDGVTPTMIADLVPSCLLTSDGASSLSLNPMVGVGAKFLCAAASSGYAQYDPVFRYGSGDTGHTRFAYGAGNDVCTLAYFLPERNGSPATDSRVKLTCDTIRAVECLYGDPRVFAGLPVVGPEFFKPHRFYSDLEMRAAHTFRGAHFGQYPDSSRNSSSNFRGATDHNLNDAYVSDPSWNYNAWAINGSAAAALGRKQGDKIDQLGGSTADSSQQGCLRSQAPYTTSSSEFSDTLFSATTVWNGVTKFSDVWKTGGDFSNGVGSEPDGPYINKPGEAGGMGDTSSNADHNYYPEWWPYSSNAGFTLSAQFSPNRLISSPVAFGSLPAGFTPTDAWHTLLFCANPNASTPALYTDRMANTDVTLANQVPSGAKCPDHLLLDFFTMPVVEPYAISEPFSTAGKVNLNYQIAPFSYIQRSSALRGVFRGTMITAVNDQFVPSKTGNETSFYKSNLLNPGWSQIVFATSSDTYGKFLTASGNWGFRYPIHAGETLKQFAQRFDNGDLFRSPSEICSLFLYPATQPTTLNPSAPGTPLTEGGLTVNWDKDNANILKWWYDNAGTTRKGLTGDNERERPYDSIYPRITTKSNSYTVHFRVQVLQKVKSTSVTQWVESKDRVVSEYRGSTLIERYIDPNDTSIPDFATETSGTASLDDYYKFRIVNTKKFTAE